MLLNLFRLLSWLPWSACDNPWHNWGIAVPVALQVCSVVCTVRLTQFDPETSIEILHFRKKCWLSISWKLCPLSAWFSKSCLKLPHPLYSTLSKVAFAFDACPVAPPFRALNWPRRARNRRAAIDNRSTGERSVAANTCMIHLFLCLNNAAIINRYSDFCILESRQICFIHHFFISSQIQS